MMVRSIWKRCIERICDIVSPGYLFRKKISTVKEMILRRDAHVDKVVPRQQTPFFRVGNATWSFPITIPYKSVHDIQVTVPSDVKGQAAAQLAVKVQGLILQNIEKYGKEAPEILKDGIVFQTEYDNKRFEWVVEPARYQRTWLGRLQQSLSRIFGHAPSPGVFIPSGTEEFTVSLIASPVGAVPMPLEVVGKMPLMDLEVQTVDDLKKTAFTDPFTVLATRCLKEYDSHYIPEATPKGDYRYIVNTDGELVLVQIDPKAEIDDVQREQNRDVIRRFQQFMIKQYGKECVDFLKTNFGVDLARCEMEGTPLFPDYVFKANIAANVVTVNTLSQVSAKISQLEKILPKDPNVEAATFLLEHLRKDPCVISVREARVLAAKAKTVGDLRQYIESFLKNLSLALEKRKTYLDLIAEIEPTSEKFADKIRYLDQQIDQKKFPVYHMGEVLFRTPKEAKKARDLLKSQQAEIVRKWLDQRGMKAERLHKMSEESKGELRHAITSLSVESFSALMELSSFSDEERERALTGRKIEHAPITGYPTVGAYDVVDPCRNFFELMQVFSDCRKQNDYTNYYELLTHVAVKKGMYQVQPHSIEAVLDPKMTYELGILLPAPTSVEGVSQWYKVDSFQDDGAGDVNYVVSPACSSYRRDGRLPPLIKLYRSTNSDKNATGWRDSVLADLNPWGAPGSLDPRLSKPYEFSFFQERTIPVWVGYLTAAQRVSKDPANAAQFREFLEKSITELDQYISREKPNCSDSPVALIDTLLAENKFHEAIEVLENTARRFGEHPSQKIQQDITFTGHSLGGALAQKGMWELTWKLGRTVLPDRTATCMSFDGPAINTVDDKAFMKFGVDHERMLKTLQIRTCVSHSHEYGDPVSLAGGSHLGTSSVSGDCSWLTFDAVINKALPDAQAGQVKLLPTHGRRFKQATVGKDYMVTRISRDELRLYDHSMMLYGDFGAKFGYKVFRSPVQTEIIRKVIGSMIQMTIRFYATSIGKRIRRYFSAVVPTYILQRFENIQDGVRDENDVFAVDEEHGGVQTF